MDEIPVMSFACGCTAKFVDERWEIVFGCSVHNILGANPIKRWVWTGAKEEIRSCALRYENGRCTGVVNDCCIRYCPGRIRGDCRINSSGTITSDADYIIKNLKLKISKNKSDKPVDCTVDENGDKQVFVFKEKSD